mmetsp:Transcript_872/g.2098  ORF Transcript_872/g.2098 Transcript_872/m.2098 type:complete len:235 (-) Transcript_872:760-1464(-)
MERRRPCVVQQRAYDHFRIVLACHQSHTPGALLLFCLYYKQTSGDRLCSRFSLLPLGQRLRQLHLPLPKQRECVQLLLLVSVQLHPGHSKGQTPLAKRKTALMVSSTVPAHPFRPPVHRIVAGVLLRRCESQCLHTHVVTHKSECLLPRLGCEVGSQEQRTLARVVGELSRFRYYRYTFSHCRVHRFLRSLRDCRDALSNVLSCVVDGFVCGPGDGADTLADLFDHSDGGALNS